MGFVMMAITAGAIGPVVAGAVYDATGSYAGAFNFFAALFIPAALIMIWLPRPGRSQPDSAES